MFLRNLLLAIGGVFVIAGVALIATWLNQPKTPQAQLPVANRQEILVATHAIRSGTLLRKEDIGWKDVDPAEFHIGNLMRSQLDETLGSVTRRDFTQGEALTSSDLVKPTDRRFLAAVLKPGARAVSISVDAPQSVAGLAQPDDHVDVILTQAFGEEGAGTVTTPSSRAGETATQTQSETNVAGPGHKIVGEAVLRDVRIVAVDHSLNPQLVPTGAAVNVPGAESRIPRTVTLELFGRDAEKIMIASQLGKFQLALLPSERSTNSRLKDKRDTPPVWASEVSPALDQVARARALQVERERENKAREFAATPHGCDPKVSLTGSTLECSVRHPIDLSRYKALGRPRAIGPSSHM